MTRAFLWVTFASGYRLHAHSEGARLTLCGRPVAAGVPSPYHDEAVTPLCGRCAVGMRESERKALRLGGVESDGNKGDDGGD